MKTQPILSNLQLELLKLYANNISDLQLFEIKVMLANTLPKKRVMRWMTFGTLKGLSEQTMIEWTNEHSRIKNRT